MYESKSKSIVAKDRVPKIEDLYVWIIRHPSYQITKPSLQKTPPKATQTPEDLVRSTPRKTPKKSKPPLTPVVPKKIRTPKSTPHKDDLIPLGKPTNKTSSNTSPRHVVINTLYEKIILRYVIFGT